MNFSVAVITSPLHAERDSRSTTIALNQTAMLTQGELSC